MNDVVRRLRRLARWGSRTPALLAIGGLVAIAALAAIAAACVALAGGPTDQDVFPVLATLIAALVLLTGALACLVLERRLGARIEAARQGAVRRHDSVKTSLARQNRNAVAALDRLKSSAADLRELRTNVDELRALRTAVADLAALTALIGDERRRLAETVTGARQEQARDITAAVGRFLNEGLVTSQREQTRDIEALLQLYQGWDLAAAMPSSGGFALGPRGLLQVLHRIRSRKPRLVLELGSGTSTVWISLVLRQFGGRLVSVDHDEQFAERTRRQLEMHGLSDVAEVRLARLQPTSIDGRTYQWYDVVAFDDLSGVNVLLVDGPPGMTGPEARYPALPLLRARLAPGCVIIVDDALRADESAIVDKWLAETPGLSQVPGVFEHQTFLELGDLDAADAASVEDS